MKILPIEILKFLSLNHLATVASISVDSDYPYVLPVFYVTDNKSHLYFASHKESKKIHNILSHPYIGISITDSSNLMSLQLQATAAVAEQNPETIQKLITTANEKSKNSMPPIFQIEKSPMELITCKINWYRLANYSGKNPNFIEGKLE